MRALSTTNHKSNFGWSSDARWIITTMLPNTSIARMFNFVQFMGLRLCLHLSGIGTKIESIAIITDEEMAELWSSNPFSLLWAVFYYVCKSSVFMEQRTLLVLLFLLKGQNVWWDIYTLSLYFHWLHCTLWVNYTVLRKQFICLFWQTLT